MGTIQLGWLREVANRNRTIGSDVANFRPQIKFSIENTRPVDPLDRVIKPFNLWGPENQGGLLLQHITPASPFSRPRPLGAHTPEADKYISNSRGWPTWPKEI